eukprot:COSAG01_NODE_366_length_18064_cov_35.830615_18_plen_40_part_00
MLSTDVNIPHGSTIMKKSTSTTLQWKYCEKRAPQAMQRN